MPEHTNNFPKLHNAMWPGLVGKEPDTDNPPIGLETMLDHTAAAEADGAKFDGVDLFLSDPHVRIDADDDALKALADAAGARRYYREAIRLDPGLADSAANLSALLIGAGQAGEAVEVLLPALRARPAHGPCWTNLVVARLELGQVAAAREAAGQAARQGVRLPSGLLAEIENRESP